MEACYDGRSKVVEMLLADERIDVNMENDDGLSPLYWASYRGHVDIVKMMLASGRQINYLEKAADRARREAAKTEKFPWETEERFQERRKKYLDIGSLIDSFEIDPEAAKARLRRELGYDERMAGELFAQVVYLSDGYLRLSEDREEETTQKRSNAKRFFNLASSMPLDLQMVLCNRVFGLEDSIVKRIHSEPGFKKFAKE